MKWLLEMHKSKLNFLKFRISHLFWDA